MRNPLDALLAVLDESDLAAKRLVLVDLRELCFRHFNPTTPHFSLNHPALADLPSRLAPGDLDRIVARVGRILLDPDEDDGLRASSAFVLGKTFDPKALTVVARAVGSPHPLPGEVVRQCGFAFDLLWDLCGPGEPPVDLDAVEAGFKARGIPWDHQTRTIAVNDL